jgi:branched-subunit amino acid aminotransferase/4-amino-4-deoxychorismate lyase
MTDVKITHS